MFKLSRYVLYDILRSKIILGYTAFLFIVAMSMFQMEENSSKAMLSLLNIVLIVLPLVSLVFSTIHFYNSYEFIELMASQPMSRTRILLSEYAGVSISLLASFLIGIGIPVIIFSPDPSGVALLFTGTCLTLVFCSIAFFASVMTRDKARAIGLVLLLWFFLTIVYDGLVLLVIFNFSDYPLEKPLLFVLSLNPVDLGRIFMTLKMDISALMGVTGASYKDFFGSLIGMVVTTGIMFLWIALPLWLAVRKFKRKDL